MTFVHPLFLWALTAVALPVVVHLFNFRRHKKVYFTNVKFLKELREESKSKSRLKEILILISRCLAVACLVLAFCQPVIKNKENQVFSGSAAISVYIDNSFSMDNVSKQGRLLEIAKIKAKELITALGSTDKFQIISNDFEGRHQRFYSKQDVLKVIDEIKASPATQPISNVLKRQTEFLKSSDLKNKKIYLFSDAQRSTFDLASLAPDSSIKTTIIQLKANKVNNIYADTCWFETPLQQKGFIQKLHARIVNNGNATIEAGSAKLFLNKSQIAISSFSLEANSSKEVLFVFECRQSGFNFGSVKIEDYPVSFDDELFFAFNSRVNVSVSLINGSDQGKTDYFSSLFKNDSLFLFQSFSENKIDYRIFKTSDVIILNQLSELSSGLLSEIIKFTFQGGALVIIPAKKSDLLSYNAALASLRLPLLGSVDTAMFKTEKIEMASGFYAGVFEKIEERMNLPVVNFHYKLLKSKSSDFESELLLQNGDDLFGVSTLNNAFLYLFSSPFNETSTNFSKHALFVPTFYKICFGSLKSAPLFYQTNSNVGIRLKNDPGNDQPPHIIGKNVETDIIPEMRMVNNALFLYTRNQVTNPGYYNVNRNDSALLPIAFNYSRKESNLNVYEPEEMAQIISEKNWKNFRLIDQENADVSKHILQEEEGKKLWKLFIILTLAFIIIEVALLRLLN